MANQVTIDVEARFIDNVSGQTKAASKAIDDVEKSAKDAAKAVDNLGKKKSEPKVDADTSSALKKLNDTDKKLKKLGNTKTDLQVTLKDRASALLAKVTKKAESFAHKTYSALVKIRDSNALSTLNKMSGGLRNITSKTWTTAVRIKDFATAPLRGIKNMLFSVKSLVLAITAGLAAKQLVINPISVADAYSSAKIGFSTLLGDSAGQKMMDDLDAFAKKTPFNTSNVISNAQKMMAMGWNPEDIIGDMEIIGNAAAATGKLDQGLESIVRAMSQIKTKGKLSTEELNQLAEAGIAAKAMLAEQLGYGTGDAGIAAMTADLEKGAIASDKAIAALLTGMQKYDGMMDSMANETVEGLKSQLGDAFEISVKRKWGQGLQDGFRKALGTAIELLDQSEDALAALGDTLYEIGLKGSNWVATKFENAVKRITEITGSYEFKNASLGEKISMLWNGVIVDPIKEWWENGGKEKTAETAGKVGRWIGEMLTKGLLALFGATDILNKDVGTDAGSNIAGSFLQGFLDTFDGSAITQAFVDAIGNIWGALPWWAKILIGGYGVGKVAGGISSLAGGVLNFVGGVGNAVGGFNIASSAFPILTSSGSGILGAVGKAGVGLGASTTGSALLMGGAGIAGGAAAGATAIKGITDLYKAYKAHKAGDKTETKAYAASGGTALAGVAAGAAIGSFFGPVGTLVGAGIGGIAGWIGGDKWANNIRESEKSMVKTEATADELAEDMERLKWENAKEHFGDMKLSLEEIRSLANEIVWGDDLGYYEKFSAAVKAAESNLQSMKTAAQQTDRWMWKAKLGVKFNDEEKASFAASFDEYVNSVKSYAENKHYEFAAAVSVLLDPESESGKHIITSGNAFYTSIQDQLDDLATQLSKKVTEAMKDGVISTEDIVLPDGTIQLSEAAEIANLQAQIADITQQIADAEHNANIELIKVKFGKGNLDYESFQTFQAQMQTTIDERMAGNDEAFIATVSSLNIRLEQGAIDQAEYDAQLQELIDGYNSNNNQLKANISDIELNIIAEAYSDVLKSDALDDLNNALKYCVDNNLDPIQIEPEVMADLLNINLDAHPVTVENLTEMLQGYYDQLGSIPAEIDVEYYARITEGSEQSLAESAQAQIDAKPDPHAVIDLLCTLDPQLLDNLDPALLVEAFGIEKTIAEDIIIKMMGEKDPVNRLKILASDFGIPEAIDHTLKVKITAIPQYNNIPTSTEEAVVPYTYGQNSSGNMTSPYYGQGYRGGIFGGDSAMDAFARGGLTDNGGIVGGSTRFIRVNEESPEMIIPLSSQRRERALRLWGKTGEMLGVPGFARGGNTSGGNDEGIRFHNNGTGDTAGGRSVEVNLGGIHMEFHVSGNDKEGIVAAIKEQVGEIADQIVGMIADELAVDFENIPMKGGVA